MTELTTGQRIAQCRKQLALSQEALGEKMGVSRQAISKWEADATLPDIDKLIALSRLFSVSVGWLLGVEEQPEPRDEAPQITEELLLKIEEIVRASQPEKKRLSRGKTILVAIAAVALLWGGITLVREWRDTRLEVAYLSAQIRNNNEQNSNILGQLSGLEERIENINTTVEEAAASLATYTFQVTPNMEEQYARVELTAFPKNWNEGWSATLNVRHNGALSVTQKCHWDGSALKARVKLDFVDGLEYWLVITYPDGTQEQIPLEHDNAQNLKTATSITCQIGGKGMPSFLLDRYVLSMASYQLHLAQPSALEPCTWVRAEYVLYHIRDDVRTTADTDSLVLTDEIGISREFWTSGRMEMQIPDIQTNDRLELWFEAELENGIRCTVKVDSWIFTQGQFAWER